MKFHTCKSLDCHSIERERIINMLETKSKCSVERGHDSNGDCYCQIVMWIIGVDNL
jgi:hypothetical protein